MGAYRACPRCGRIHPYDQPCPMKKPTYRYERTGADRLRFTSRWKRKSLQVRDDAHWMCEVCIMDDSMMEVYRDSYIRPATEAATA